MPEHSETEWTDGERALIYLNFVPEVSNFQKAKPTFAKPAPTVKSAALELLECQQTIFMQMAGKRSEKIDELITLAKIPVKPSAPISSEEKRAREAIFAQLRGQ